MTVEFSELQKLSAEAIIEMFIIEGNGERIYFHAGTNQLGENIKWQGQEYVRYPIEASGFEFSGSGPAPRPKLLVSNFMSSVTAVLMGNDDLLGFKVTRKRTLAKYMDAENFKNGNANADPDSHFADDIYYIDRKAAETSEAVEFELVSALDLQGVKLPRRQIIQNSCCWKYRSANCGYAGNRFYDKNDQPTTNSKDDFCGKKLKSCKVRFGESSELPYGGFPGADLVR